MSQLRIIASIEEKTRLLERESDECTKNGDHQWAVVLLGRVLGLLDARNVILEAMKKGDV